MREFVDGILEIIGSASLNDQEYAENFAAGYWNENYEKKNYDAIKALLEARESVSNATERLKALFLANGTDIDSAAKTAQSNIFIGSPL